VDDPATRRRRCPGTGTKGRGARRARRAALATIAAVTVTLGSAPPLGAQGTEIMGPPTDGGSQARWVAGELALLVIGSIGGRMWAVRRSRRRQQAGGAVRSPAGAASPRARRRGRGDGARSSTADAGQEQGQGHGENVAFHDLGGDSWRHDLDLSPGAGAGTRSHGAAPSRRPREAAGLRPASPANPGAAVAQGTGAPQTRGDGDRYHGRARRRTRRRKLAPHVVRL
jgi:hypothetical protein